MMLQREPSIRIDRMAIFSWLPGVACQQALYPPTSLVSRDGFPSRVFTAGSVMRCLSPAFTLPRWSAAEVGNMLMRQEFGAMFRCGLQFTTWLAVYRLLRLMQCRPQVYGAFNTAHFQVRGIA